MADTAPAQTTPKEMLADYIRHPTFKRLLDQIIVAQQEKPFKSLAVLSEFPKEGKTFLISVLALGYAKFLRKRVLIMDTISQTRNESFYVGRVLNPAGTGEEPGPAAVPPGLIDLITTRNIYRQVHHYQGQLNGSAPSFEDLDDDNSDLPYDTTDFRIAPFLNSLVPNYDLILLDTCSLTETHRDKIDPLILARQVDKSVLLTSPISSERTTIQHILGELKNRKIDLLGTVFNSGAVYAG